MGVSFHSTIKWYRLFMKKFPFIVSKISVFSKTQASYMILITKYGNES
jgi:hypothetical protein